MLRKAVVAGSGWLWLALAGSGLFWVALAGSGWLWVIPPFSNTVKKCGKNDYACACRHETTGQAIKIWRGLYKSFCQ